MLRWSLVVLFGMTSSACAHRPETVVHLSAPHGAWIARDTSGTRLCSLPCRLELDANESVVVQRESGAQAFVVQQVNLGRGTWNGTVHVRREPTEGALALKAFSDALMTTGGAMVATRSEDRRNTGLVLTGIGTIGVIASESWRGPPREELRLERLAPATD